MNDFYVYVFLREDRYSPYYIGKGKGKRCWAKDKTRSGVVPPTDKSRVVKVKENLTEEEAFGLEKKLILFWGRKIDGGVLYNRSEGGAGGNNMIHPPTEKHKMKTSISMKKAYERRTKKWRLEKARKAAETKHKKDGYWDEYSKLPIWDKMVDMKGTSIVIRNIDTNETFTYRSYKEAERDGWSRKMIYLKVRSGEIWKVRGARKGRYICHNK